VNLRPKGVLAARLEEHLCLIEKDDAALGLARFDPMSRERDVRIGIGGIDLDRSSVHRKCALTLAGRVGIEACNDETQRSAPLRIPSLGEVRNVKGFHALCVACRDACGGQ
jgi:hypothetical protein